MQGGRPVAAPTAYNIHCCNSVGADVPIGPPLAKRLIRQGQSPCPTKRSVTPCVGRDDPARRKTSGGQGPPLRGVTFIVSRRGRPMWRPGGGSYSSLRSQTNRPLSGGQGPAVFIPFAAQYASFSSSHAFSSLMGTLTCSMVSRSRMVTALSACSVSLPTVWKSTVMQ